MSPKCPSFIFLIFCNKLDFQKAQKVPSFTILKPLRFLSLWYSADFGRSRLDLKLQSLFQKVKNSCNIETSETSENYFSVTLCQLEKQTLPITLDSVFLWNETKKIYQSSISCWCLLHTSNITNLYILHYVEDSGLIGNHQSSMSHSV